MKTIRYTMRVRQEKDPAGQSWKESITRDVEDNVTPEDDAKMLIAEFNDHLREGEERREFISLVVRE